MKKHHKTTFLVKSFENNYFFFKKVDAFGPYAGSHWHYHWKPRHLEKRPLSPWHWQPRHISEVVAMKKDIPIGNRHVLEIVIDQHVGSGRFGQTVLTNIGFGRFWQTISELQMVRWPLFSFFKT